MEMCYSGALVMPSSCALMSEDEMMYVEGGDGKRLQNNLLGLYNRTQGYRLVWKIAGVNLAMIKSAAQCCFSAAVCKFGPVILKLAACSKVLAVVLGASAFAAAAYLWNKRVFY